MAANYLQNSKAILISWMLLLALTSFNGCNLSKSLYNSQEPSDDIKDINHFLEFRAIFPSDTLRIGETVRIEVLFKNKSDSTIRLFPVAITVLTRIYGMEAEIYPINIPYDYSKSIELKPKAIYSCSYFIQIEKSFFVLGENVFHITYTFCPKGKNRIYSKMYGLLASPDILLVAKP